ncbi:MAG TPA: DGQHR domain-containing protein [Gemmatimonadaceae bacterium]|nr:DGQHR domain-containing protein [Gemmatimonadaceae bacterium]
MSQSITLQTLTGKAAGRDVLLGFAPASLLASLSFADVLDEAAGTGYQRRFSPPHSLDFRRYIKRPESTTPPLTFNLRPRDDSAWLVIPSGEGHAVLVLSVTSGRILAQVDCQHRLGHIGDLDLTLPFMVFLGLSEREEMEVFNTINSKAMGLSSSLLDYHAAHLARDLGTEKPELLIALRLNDDPESPWYKQLDLGGRATSGLKRRASLRTMQKAVRRFLSATEILQSLAPEEAARLVRDFWSAVATVLHSQWCDPRRHFLTKGVGVYALTGMLGDLWTESTRTLADFSRAKLAERLEEFAPDFDWTSEGPLKGLGGEAGAQEALAILRRTRDLHLRLVTING